MDNSLLVRELEERDIPLIINYWFTSTPEHLHNMGADITKLPTPEQFTNNLLSQLALPYNEKKAYALIWEVNGKPIGHCNVNPLFYGNYANMHLHIWDAGYRKQGLGLNLVKMSLPYYFNNLKIKKLYCEPYALNPAPNKLLEKAGFIFVKEHINTPGSINFEQLCNLWEMAKP